MTTTITLRINQSRCLFPTNMHNSAEILSYWVEVLILEMLKDAPDPSLWLSSQYLKTTQHCFLSSCQLQRANLTNHHLQVSYSQQEFQSSRKKPRLCKPDSAKLPKSCSLISFCPWCHFCHAGIHLKLPRHIIPLVVSIQTTSS